MAAIGLGSNLGDRRGHLRAAVQGLREQGELVGVSSLYETEPLGGPEQGPYLNAVVLLDTELTPSELLEACLELERATGRERRERWGPRTLDLDLLLYGTEEVDQPGLTVPHPALADRRFVVEPLLELWPEARMPDGQPIGDFWADLLHQQAEIVQGPGWATPPPSGRGPGGG
ncbi:MAG: 2-amino-4-hydroxy-6-hydroxymethyldihydropteridine diphosphokinase [Acidimicrobiia bacterium]